MCGFVSSGFKAGDEWKPEYVPLEVEVGLVREVPGLNKLKHDIFERSDGFLKEDVFKGVSYVIVDPFIFYVPYHSSSIGIYFRIDRMLSDFENFCLKYLRDVKRLGILTFWHVYVMIIFWHVMAHHVIEDIASVLEQFGRGRYPLFERGVEESFCEYVAFITAEDKLSPPGWCKVPILPKQSVPKIIGRGQLRNRKLILTCLYHHWKKASKNKPYVNPIIPKTINGLWNGFWGAHKSGLNVLDSTMEVYNHIYVTHL